MASKKSDATAVSARFQRPGFKDPRLLIGLLLIAVSIVAVIGILRLGNKTAPYYKANRDISVGEKISAGDYSLIDVRLADAENLYVSEQQGIPEGAVATSRIASGQLLPSASISTQNTDGRRLATVTVDSAYASTLTAGTQVDVWVSAKQDGAGNSFADPTVVMEGAEISKISNEETLMGGTGKSAVQLLVSEDALGTILRAINNEEKINLVPTDFSQKG